MCDVKPPFWQFGIVVLLALQKIHLHCISSLHVTKFCQGKSLHNASTYAGVLSLFLVQYGYTMGWSGFSKLLNIAQGKAGF